MESLPVCSIIIPAYRSQATISACLTALLQQDFAQPYEIIVVNSSADETAYLVQCDFPGVQVIQLAQQTDPAQARNIGAQRARGEVLAFVDSDCVAATNWLRRLYNTLQQGYDAVGGAITNGNGESLASWAGYLCEFREFLPEGAARDTQNLTLGNAAYRRTVFWQHGGFPAGYFPQEDQVFHRMLVASGARIRYDPQIRVAHQHRSEYIAFREHQRRIGQANARVLCQIDAPGSAIARRPVLAPFAVFGLVPLRFARTVWACRRVEDGLVLRLPALLWMCWNGMRAWGRGFVEGACAARMARAEGRGRDSGARGQGSAVRGRTIVS